MEKQTILFVDDELDMRIFLSTVLKSAGYAAVSARNALEGLERAREHAPDLVSSPAIGCRRGNDLGGGPSHSK